MLDNTLQKNSLRGKLTSTNYLKVSYSIILKFDGNTAIFLSTLVHLEMYNEKHNKVDPNGFFMVKRDYIEKRTGLTKKIQMRVTEALSSQNLISYIKKGVPQTGWIRLNHALINLVIDNYSFVEEDL